MSLMGRLDSERCVRFVLIEYAISGGREMLFLQWLSKKQKAQALICRYDDQRRLAGKALSVFFLNVFVMKVVLPIKIGWEWKLLRFES